MNTIILSLENIYLKHIKNGLFPQIIDYVRGNNDLIKYIESYVINIIHTLIHKHSLFVMFYVKIMG